MPRIQQVRTRTALAVAAALVVLAVPAVPSMASTSAPVTHVPTTRPGPPTPPAVDPQVPRTRPAVRTYVQHVETRDRVVFLTIDDGVVRDPAFLALVRREHLPVTVFITDSVLGGGHKAYFQALQAAGAVIENHTLSHADLTRVLATERTRQVCGAQAADRRIFGATPTLMRPPYGAVSSAVIATAIGCGLHAVIGWDAVMPERGSLQTWNGGGVLHRGDIVLMHFRPGLTAQVQRLARLVRSQGLTFALLEDYI